MTTTLLPCAVPAGSSVSLNSQWATIVRVISKIPFSRGPWECTQPEGLPPWLSVKESACNAGERGSVPGLGRSPGGGFGNPLQCSCLENHMEIGVWWATVHGIAKCRAQLKLLSVHKLCNIPFVSCLLYMCVCVCVCMLT